jgi:hypothetical protein
MNQKAELIKNTIPQMNSSSAEWIEWHKNMKSRYGKSTANSLWLKAWKFRGNSKSNTNELRTYMSNNGVKIDSSSFDKIVDVGDSIIDKVGNIVKVGGIGAIFINFAILGGVAYILYSVISTPDKYTSAVKKVM